MEKGNFFHDLSVVLNCSNCRTKWDIIIRGGRANAKGFQTFLGAPCVNCGSDNQSISILSIQSM